MSTEDAEAGAAEAGPAGVGAGAQGDGTATQQKPTEPGERGQQDFDDGSFVLCVQTGGSAILKDTTVLADADAEI